MFRFSEGVSGLRGVPCSHVTVRFLQYKIQEQAEVLPEGAPELFTAESRKMNTSLF